MAEDFAALPDDEMQVDFVAEIEIDVVFRPLIPRDPVGTFEAVPPAEKRMESRLHRARQVAEPDLVNDAEKGAVSGDVERALARSGTLHLHDVEQAIFRMHGIDAIDPAGLGVVVDRPAHRFRALSEGNAFRAHGGEGAAEQVRGEIEDELLLHERRWGLDARRGRFTAAPEVSPMKMTWR